MNICTADLHVHTALSPCAADEMTPPAIVAAALAAGLDVIAVCDHNSARNAAAVQAAAGDRLGVISGMEITSAEECHIVGLFPNAEAASAAGAEVGAALPTAADGYTRFFGEQHVLAADGERTDDERLALALATTLSINEVVELVHRHGGLAVAAHIDRSTFGVIGQLGFFPADAGFDAVELSRHVVPGSADEERYRVHGMPILHSSDGHYPADIGAVRTTLHMLDSSFAELACAVRGADGRSVDDA